jgi:hypothetical protein
MLLLVLIVRYAKRSTNAHFFLRIVLGVLVITQLVFSIPGFHTSFSEAAPVLKALQVIDWSEAITCAVLFVALQRQNIPMSRAD